MPTSSLRLGSRGSQLALYQAHAVAARIAETGGPHCEIVVIKTSGDRLQDAPLSEAGGKRLFVKELEDALLRDEIDLAVHSSKDMPALLPPELSIAGVLPRADPHDAVVLPRRPGTSEATTVISNLEALKRRFGATPTIGTSSVRRIAQVLRLVPGAVTAPIRGNLDTRLRKLDAGDYDALVLAAAGLKRLNLGERISFRLPLTESIPAPGQGIIAIETRSDDRHVRTAVSPIVDRLAWAALDAERALVEALGGGCQTPIGALAQPRGENGLRLTASVISLDGRELIEASGDGHVDTAERLGRNVAQELVERGARAILEAAQRASSLPLNEADH